MTAYKRPEYTKKVLDNLQSCIGFEEYLLLPTVEPEYKDVIDLFSNIPNCEIIVNKTKLGCATNTMKALTRGFEKSDFVIHLEDDTVPGIDSLKYFEHINKNYKDDKQILTVTAYNNVRKISTKDYFTYYKRHWFTGWMWASWIDRFEEMKNNWDYVDKFGWDVNINKNIRKINNRYEICPVLPRSQNIGQYEGTYTKPGHWKRQQYNSIWVNSIKELNFNNLITNYTEVMKRKTIEPRLYAT